MARVLVLFAHPNPQRSRINRHLARSAATLDGVEVRDLYEAYPNFHINAVEEQEALQAADAIVMQFPVYWFSAPAILREWQDSVLAKGFAFGPGGSALEGKKFMLAVTTGGDEGSYAETRPHGAPLADYLKPFEQTARFCGMQVMEPFLLYGVGGLDAGAVEAHVATYQSRLKGLLGGRGVA